MKVLYLNTADKIIKMGLIEDNKSKFIEFEQNNDLAESLSEKIEKFLNENKADFKDLTCLSVFRGPGGFTSLRIGIVTINTMAYLLKIPVIEIAQNQENAPVNIIRKKLSKKDFKSMVLPFYGKEPNITKPKKF